MSDLLDQEDEARQALAPQGDPADEYTDLQALPAPAVALEGAPAPRQQPRGAPVADLQIPNHTPAADGAALDAAEHHRRMAYANAGLQDAGALALSPWLKSTHNGGDATRKSADEEVNAVFKRRALEDQDRQLAAQQHEAALNAALARGDSPESIKIKDAFGGTTVGSALRSRMGPDAWMKLPGHAIPGAKEQLGSETELMKSQLKAQAAGGGEDPQHLITGVAVARGEQPAAALQGLSAAELRHSFIPVATNESNHQAAQQQQGRAISQADKAREDTQTHQEDLLRSQRQVGGYHVADPRGIPSESQHTAFSKLAGATGSVMSGLDAVTEAYNKADSIDKIKSLVMDTPMKQILTSARVQAKELFNLGVLNGKDFELLSQTIPDPTGFSGLVMPKNMAARMAAAKQIFARALTNAAKANGYAPDDAAPPSAGTVNPGPTPPTAAVVKEPSGAAAAGVPAPAPEQAKTVVKKQFSPSRNQTRVTYSDGTTEVINGR